MNAVTALFNRPPTVPDAARALREAEDAFGAEQTPASSKALETARLDYENVSLLARLAAEKDAERAKAAEAKLRAADEAWIARFKSERSFEGFQAAIAGNLDRIAASYVSIAEEMDAIEKEAAAARAEHDEAKERVAKLGRAESELPRAIGPGDYRTSLKQAVRARLIAAGCNQGRIGDLT